MYESPITQIMGEMTTKYEDDCLKVVQSYGFTVNKEELTKALQYDRGQYTKGYDDGYTKAIDDFAEALQQKCRKNFEVTGILRVGLWEIQLVTKELKGNKAAEEKEG